MTTLDYYLNKLKKDRFVIFLFHGVIDKDFEGVRNYTKKHMNVDTFEEIILNLKKKGNPISMDEIVYYQNINKDIPKYSYAITFDDGFYNNYTLARPILENYSTPATFYISTNLIENNYMTWIDKLEYCLNKAPCLNILLPWNAHPIKLIDENSKINCLEQIRKNIKSNPSFYNIQNFVDNIYYQCSEKQIAESDHILYKKMKWDQIREMNLNSLFTIGGHSHNHVSLGSLNYADLRYEIETSIDLVKNNVGINLVHYSYPEGQKSDYSIDVINLLKKFGIKCCPTAIDGLNDQNTDLFHLRRIML